MTNDVNDAIKNIENTPESTPKKRGRKKGTKAGIDFGIPKGMQAGTPPEQKPDGTTSDVFKDAVGNIGGVLLDIASPRLPNAVPFSDQEKKMFNDALTPVIDKYFIGVGQYEAEVSLILVSLIIFYPRLIKPVKKKDSTTPKDKPKK